MSTNSFSDNLVFIAVQPEIGAWLGTLAFAVIGVVIVILLVRHFNDGLRKRHEMPSVAIRRFRSGTVVTLIVVAGMVTGLWLLREIIFLDWLSFLAWDAQGDAVVSRGGQA